MDADVVRHLLERGAEPNALDEAGYTPLLWCCFRGAVGEREACVVARQLVDRGADIEARTLNGEATPLLLAVESGNGALVSLLLSLGASVHATAEGVSPLMVAARGGNSEIVEQLQRAGADASLKCMGYTAADYAEHGGYPELANALRSTVA